MNWIAKASALQAEGISFVIVTICSVEGSAPREVGARMLVMESGQFDSVGGGKLEYELSREARTMLAEGCTRPRFREIALGASMGQCCGGRVEVMLEPVIANSPRLLLFGAGHVGKALVDLLTPLEIPIRWIDRRQEMFEGYTPSALLEFVNHDDEIQEASECKADSLALVMTHSHTLDYDIVQRLLQAENCPRVLLIGSATKAKSFQSRLKQMGVSAQRLENLECPIGSKSRYKHPKAVAIGIAARVLDLL